MLTACSLPCLSACSAPRGTAFVGGCFDPLAAIKPTVALASGPVLVGYSLVGVYPCAVWRPRRGDQQHCASCNSRAAAGLRVASTVRAAPYPQPAAPEQQQCRCSRSGGGVAASVAEHDEQPVNNHTAPATATLGAATPMLFVPFQVPSFAPPLAGSLAANASPSAANTPAKVAPQAQLSKTADSPRRVQLLLSERLTPLYYQQALLPLTLH